MHYCTAMFHRPDSDPESLMHPYSYENPEYEEFTLEYEKEQGEQMFKKFKKKSDKNKNQYKNIDDFMQVEYGCYAKDDYGDFGNEKNPNGLYDWFEVGGRWKDILHKKVSQAQMKKRQNADLKDKMKFKERLAEYMRLRQMKPADYCIDQKCFPGRTTLLCKDLDVEATIKLNSDWAGKVDDMGDLFETIICEETGVREEDDFNDLLEYWTNKGGCITIIDYHS